VRYLLSVAREVAVCDTRSVSLTDTRFISFKACWSAWRYWRWSGSASA